MGEKRLVRWLAALLLLGLVVIADRAGAADLQTLQQALAVRGYDTGVADGVYGPQTQAAIRAFEADMGWQRTGRVSPRLVRALEPPRKLPPIQLRPPSSVAPGRQQGRGQSPRSSTATG